MDDTKLFAKYEKVLETLILVVGIYNDDIGMELGKEKCALLIMKSRKRQITEEIKKTNQEKIETIGEKETWKYWKWIPSNKRTWKKKFKNTSIERENYSKPNYIAEISWKG